MNRLFELFPQDRTFHLTGVTKQLSAFFIGKKFEETNQNILIVTSNLYEANQLYNAFYNISLPVYLFPADEFLTAAIIAASPEFIAKRLETINNLKKNKKCVVITNLTGYLHQLPSLRTINNLECLLSVGQEINRRKLQEILDRFGYQKVSLVTASGEYAIRGFVIDLFIFNESDPVRIEFFDNEIVAIRYFSSDSQLTIKKIEQINILPFKEIETNEHDTLVEYMKKPQIIYYNFNQIIAANEKLEEDVFNYQQKEPAYQKNLLDFKNIIDYNAWFISEYDDYLANIKIKTYHVNAQVIDNISFDNNIDFLINKYLNNKKTVIIGSMNINKMKKMFDKYPIKEIKNIFQAEEKVINLINMTFINNFEVSNYVFISDNKNNDNAQINYRSNLYMGRKIKDYKELNLNDYVVHRQHGIGIYVGLKTLNKLGFDKDYLEINYAGNDKIYIPVEKIDLIYKYADRDGTPPRINRLNSPTWKKNLVALKKRIKDISDQLLSLYQARAKIKSQEYFDFPEELIFASEFPYEETRDQFKAINDINADLKSAKPMDRILCGDVGFGKTEVAFRAAFKTILNGYQVIFLCPTTILSKQHFNNAQKRFSNYGVNIALLNRFTTRKELEDIKTKLLNKQIDLVIGTHRLLSKDIVVSNPGLLVVDEEQRFGVTHKEQIKEFKKDINILTLTATPIPRTLKFALSGLRDLSIIDTPPVNRYPIQTYVMPENELLVKEIIMAELARDGQVFILYNNVEKTISKLNDLKRLIPDANIRYGHGKMTKTELNSIMEDFVEHKFDILLCTTIIETGIDIPNVNTLLVYDANNFGLSQLYQLRGRVGRSDKIAYAYLMYQPSKVLSEMATKRLQAIKEFTELGSGYKIAMRDLSIRGAGDFLGSEQAGFIESVGLDFYLKLLDESFTEEDIPETKELIVNTHIKDSYVAEESIKIEIHQRINEIDSLEKLQNVKTEIEDRFGKIDFDLEIYMYQEWLEKLLTEREISILSQTNDYLKLEFSKESSKKVSGDKLFLIAYNINPKIKIIYHHEKIKLTIPIKSVNKHYVLDLIDLLTKI